MINWNWKENYKYKKNYLKNIVINNCDICYKKSSFTNRTCNKCFKNLSGENNEM